jgi:flagellar hook-basal body complex protein FliE
MIDATSNNLPKISGVGGATPGATSASGGTGESSFADMLKKNIDEVSKLQQDASQAVNDVATGQTQDVTGVMTAVEKADMAFKTLLTIRAKLMDAYQEIKGINV